MFRLTVGYINHDSNTIYKYIYQQKKKKFMTQTLYTDLKIIFNKSFSIYIYSLVRLHTKVKKKINILNTCFLSVIGILNLSK